MSGHINFNYCIIIFVVTIKHNTLTFINSIGMVRSL
jgi:hypothetical protein